MDIKLEKVRLQKIEYKANICLREKGEGTLVFSKSNDVLQFYKVVNGKREYLSKKKQRAEICKLAQERYARQLLKVLENMKVVLNSFASGYDKNRLEEVYDGMPEELKEYVISYTPNYEEYGEAWAHRAFKRKNRPENTEYRTDNGEYVRSKSELIIANKLKAMGLKYRYECAKLLRGYGTIYPDFTILDPNTYEEVILEHFGLMNSEDYLTLSFFKKLETYAKNGIAPGKGLICTFETSKKPLNTESLENILSVYFDKIK